MTTKSNIFFRIIGIATLCLIITVSCNKKDDPEPGNPYKTSTGGLFLITDSVNGQLGELQAEVTYKMKCGENGISFLCYDQSIVSKDTTFGEVVMYFSLNKKNLDSKIYIDTVYPSTKETETKLLGIQDSIYIKILRDPGASENSVMGKFSFKAKQTRLPLQDATTIVVNDPDYLTVDQITKPAGSKYFEKWLKAKVSPDSTYFIQFLRSNESAEYSLGQFNCDFFSKDGVTSYPGTDISKGGKVLQASDRSSYVEHTIAKGQNYLYIRCFSNVEGTNGVRILDQRP